MKSKLYVLIIFIAFGCSKNESGNINKPPSDFEVNVESKTYNNVKLAWSESFDPEAEQVTYSIYIEGNLIENNLSVRSYNFKNLNPSKSYIGRVVAYDTSGNETSKTFTFTTSDNLHPTSFEIISIIPDNVSVYVSWTKSFDPEEREVVYSLYLNEELIISEYNFENFNFDNLSVNTLYNGKIIALDPEGNETVLNFEVKTADGIYHGDVSFVSQSSVDDFGSKGYIEIAGNLEITGFVANSDITDLSNLRAIKKVQGYFTIFFCDELTNLDGLGIEHIGKSLRIKNNRKLENINGLGDLKEILGDFDIIQNTVLETIEGLNNLVTIGSVFRISNNVALTKVKGFEKLTFTDYILIDANWPLKEVSGFNLLQDIEGDFSIKNNPEVELIEGFSKLKTVGRLYLEDTLITNIDMFYTLTTVSGDLYITGNKELKNIKGLSSLENIVYGNLIISNNSKIKSLEGLENLVSIGGTLGITNNILLSDFCALQKAMQDFNPDFRESITNNSINPTITQIANGECN